MARHPRSDHRQRYGWTPTRQNGQRRVRGVASVLVLLMVLHGPIRPISLNVFSAALAASAWASACRGPHWLDRRYCGLLGHDLL